MTLIESPCCRLQLNTMVKLVQQRKIYRSWKQVTLCLTRWMVGGGLFGCQSLPTLYASVINYRKCMAFGQIKLIFAVMISKNFKTHCSSFSTICFTSLFVNDRLFCIQLHTSCLLAFLYNQIETYQWFFLFLYFRISLVQIVFFNAFHVVVTNYSNIFFYLFRFLRSFGLSVNILDPAASTASFRYVSCFGCMWTVAV